MTVKKHIQYIDVRSPVFVPLIKAIHKSTADDLDSKVRKGIHEPGHGSAHMEMTLHFFHWLSSIIQVPVEKVLVGSLATIFHDIWRENIHESHTVKSAEKADRILKRPVEIDGEFYCIDDFTRDIITRMIHSHSTHSSRSEKRKIPDDWKIVTRVLQGADMLASGGTFGYLRNFSYSGHVLKSMIDRIKTIVKTPKKFSDPLPEKLRLFLSASQNAFHEWILSIMLMTDRKTIEFSDIETYKKFIFSFIKLGVAEKNFSKSSSESTVNFYSDSYKKMNINKGQKDIVTIIHDKIDINQRASLFFNELMQDLNEFASKGLLDLNTVDPDIENDILILLEYGVPGICSRALWGQFNPVDIETGTSKLTGYLTLPDRIESFMEMLSTINGDPEKVGIKTEEGRVIFKKTFRNSKLLVENAIKQYKEERWTYQMWDLLN